MGKQRKISGKGTRGNSVKLKVKKQNKDC